MSFRRRTYPEVLDSLLTTVAAGVAAEPHPFPPPGAAGPPWVHHLERPPVRDVASVYGSRAGQPHQFRKDGDFVLKDGRTLEWREGGDLPDPGTVVQVNYYPAASPALLTDLQPGSVVRTLAESFALEAARLYAQLEAVYRSGFIDLAEGAALDNVVALLGIERVRAGRATGEVEFTRAEGSRGVIHIPAGTRVLTADGEIEYETTAATSLADGQRTVRVTARDLETQDGVAAGALSVLPAPIAGIAAVTNPAPTAVGARDETDEELRQRAKSFLHGSERATTGSLRTAAARQGIAVDLAEPGGGVVVVTPRTEALSPEQIQRLDRALQDARPAGVVVQLAGAEPPRRVDLSLALTTAQGLLEQDRSALQQVVRSKVADLFARLGAGETASFNRLVGQVLSVPGVEDVRLLSATWQVDGTDVDVLDAANGVLAVSGFPTVLGELDLADPQLPTLLDAVVTHPPGEPPPDAAAIRAALNAAVTYWNTANATPAPGEEAKRTVSFGKLLLAIPLPGKPAGSLADYDTAAAAGAAPPLPANSGGAGVYQARFVLTQRGGLTLTLEEAGDAYPLTPFERLALNGAEVMERSDG